MLTAYATDDTAGLMLQAVTELGTAMKAGERGRLEDAIRHGTAILYKASAAPDTASVAAAVSCCSTSRYKRSAKCE